MSRLLVSTIFLLTIFLSNIYSHNDEKENWSIKERQYYQLLQGLAEYVFKKTKNKISKDTLYAKYIYFDNVLNDSNKARRERRLAEFDTIFSHIPRKIDSIGLENLDA